MSKEAQNLVELQYQIRRNAEEYQEYLSDLSKWTKDINQKDEELKKTTVKRNFPPIRYTENFGNQQTVTKEVPKEASKTKAIFEDADEEPFAEKKAVEFKDQGNYYFRESNFAKAVEYYNKSLELKEDAVVYCNRAAAFLKLKKHKEAEVDCTKTISLDYTNLKAYCRRGLARRELGDFEGSVQDFERALSLKPGLAETQKELATSRDMLKRKLEAEKAKHATPSPIKETKKKMVIEDVEEVEELVTPSASKLNASLSQSRETTKPKEQIPKPQASPQPKETPKPQEKPVATETPKPAAEQKPAASVQAKVEQKTPEPAPTPATTTTSKPAAKKQETPIFVPKVKPKIPTNPPATSFEFEKYLNQLEKPDFYEYLRIVPPASFNKIFKESFTSEIMSPIIDAVKNCYLSGSNADSEENQTLALDILSNLPTVNRFDVVAMFMETKERKDLEVIFSILLAKMPANKAKIDAVKAKFFE